MLRQVIAVFILTCVLSANFSRDLVIAGFSLNQKYIAETLCVNRNRPELHCNGRCYLMNKLRQAEEGEKRQAAKELRVNLQTVWNVQSSLYFSPLFVAPAIQLRGDTHYQYFYSSQYNDTIFRPPKVLS